MKNQMTFKAGDIVVTNFSNYQHWSLVTDKMCNKGKPKLISVTNRNGTVQEETWDEVTQGRHTYVTKLKIERPLHEVLQNARAQINKWVYSIESNNCEHFVKWSAGLEITSTQVKAVVVGGVAGVALVHILSDNPKLVHYLGSAFILGSLALATTRAIEDLSK